MEILLNVKMYIATMKQNGTRIFGIQIYKHFKIMLSNILIHKKFVSQIKNT